MPLVTNAAQARQIIEQYRENKISMPCFCAENTFTMEGILIGASQIAKASARDVAIYIAATGNYHGRQQLKNYTSLNDTWEGFLAFKSDMQRLCRADGPFNNVIVIPALDHGQPELDDRLFEQGRDFWGCVMYDCSARPLDQNRQMVKEFVKNFADEYVIEGCVDEITESGQGGMKLTDPNDAKQFIDETGADLIVANLGTEHRVTGDKKQYRSDIARKIYEQTGRRIVLHGTSCLSQDDIAKLPADGIAKVNIWTVLETKTTQEMFAKMLEHASDILPPALVNELKKRNMFGSGIELKPDMTPKLEYLTEVYRRNAIKTPSVAQITYEFMKKFGY